MNRVRVFQVVFLFKEGFHFNIKVTVIFTTSISHSCRNSQRNVFNFTETFTFSNVPRGTRSRSGTTFIHTENVDGGIFADILEQMLGVSGARAKPERKSTANPFRSMFSDSRFTSESKRNVNVASDDTIQVLECTLQELYNGCQKKLRLAFNMDPFRQYEREFVINVKKGWKNGTRVRFEETPQFPIPVTFVVKVKPHKYFKVDGNDLIWHCTLTQKQFEKGVLIKVPLLNDQLYELNTKALKLDNNMEVFVKGKGMPLSSLSSSQRYGNLVIKFNIRK